MVVKKREEIRRDFAQITSCHGLAQIYASTNTAQKIFWCILILAVLSFLVFQLVLRIQEYNEKNTTTSISEIYTDTLDFPAITICNFNHFFGVDSQKEQNAIDELSKVKSNFDDEEFDMNKLAYFDDAYGGSIRNYSIAKGWDLNDETLVWCFSEENDCTWENFTYSITDLGKCWTIRIPEKIQRAGSRHGLSMIFNVQHSNYTEQATYGNWEAGIKVQVHAWNDEPEVDQLGMAVPVGNMAFISMHKTEESIMYHPWGECDPALEELNYHSHYSIPNCFQECFQDTIDENCQCRLYLFNESLLLHECNLDETISCLNDDKIYADHYLTSDNCKCQPPCKTERFDTSISYAAIPNEAVESEIAGTVGMDWSELRDNLAGVTIFYRKMSYTKQVNSKALTESGLLSDLGGQLGLWIGISIVTIFEFVQFVTMYCIESVASAKRKRNKIETMTNEEIDI